MKPINYLLYAAVLCVSTGQFATADCEHGAVHMVLPDGEEVVDCTMDGPLPGDAPTRPWYLHEHFDYYNDDIDPTYELEDETAWPGQREDFSDYLFR